MKQAKLDDFGKVAETVISEIPKIIKAVARHYETVLREIGKDDSNITYYGGTLREAKWRHNTRYNIREYDDLPEHLTICGEVSDRIYEFIEKKFGHGHAVIIEGHFLGEGAQYSEDKSSGHMFVVLEDGTIIDGAYKQYQDPCGGKPRKRIRFVSPNEPEYADYGFSATTISSSYGADYNPKGRVKIPIDNAVVSKYPWSLEFQVGEDRLYTSGKSDERLITEQLIDPIASKAFYARKKKEREELEAKYGSKGIYERMEKLRRERKKKEREEKKKNES